MTGSVAIDLLVVGVALLAGVSGWRSGAAASGFALFGVALGLIGGLLLAPYVSEQIEDPSVRLVTVLVVLLVLVGIGQTAGMILGRAIRNLIYDRRAQVADAIGGALFQGIAALMVMWLISVPLTADPTSTLSRTLRGSWVLSQINDATPRGLQDLPARLGGTLNSSGLPDVFGPLGDQQVRDVAVPDGALATAPVATEMRPVVLKILGQATSCSRNLEGSGFVWGDDLVMTNAHVVAGTDVIRVEAAGGERLLPARVVWIDTDNDIAVLSVPGLAIGPPARRTDLLGHGGDVLVLGYPGNGPYTATPARVREVIMLRGPNIHQDRVVQREVYTLRGGVRQGNSGGPLVDTDGRVVGLVFGAGANDADTGYALTMRQVEDAMSNARYDLPRDTGECVSG